MTSCNVFNPIPQPKREFRGFWVATVVNIDWPKKGTDPIEKQKRDYLNILKFYKDLNFNAAIVQLRTAGDAFYDSNYAPWSRFLTGTEGQSPDMEEDILAWMIAQTHKQGMEFHAWLNPYRATFDLKTDVLSPTHDYFLHPEWMVKYGKKYYYDPGLPQVQERLVSLMEELVQNYEMDAVHFDDYFYPYKIKGEVFKDSLSYANHSLPGQSLADWRRSNVDSLVRKSHRMIKAAKPWVQFGVSPFGVWRNQSADPRGSDTQAGQTNYDDLYANPILWMEKGWLDYIVPQVYWSMDLEVASHQRILGWWAALPYPTNLYIGNGPYKIRNNNDTAWDNKKELPDQLKLARKTDDVGGNVFFSAKSLQYKNADVTEYLKKRFYQNQALPPVSPLAPSRSEKEFSVAGIRTIENGYQIDIGPLEEYRYALVYASGPKQKAAYPIKKLLGKLPIKDSGYIKIGNELVGDKKHIALTTLDKFGHESNPVRIHLDRIRE
ncbi:MAG: family 10 glycosylhydrolase [Bacteroidota bacterium]